MTLRHPSSEACRGKTRKSCETTEAGENRLRNAPSDGIHDLAGPSFQPTERIAELLTVLTGLRATLSCHGELAGSLAEIT